MNVLRGFLIFAVTLMVCRVNGFVTPQCKDSETATDKFGRFLENANCTLHRSGEKIKTKLNHIHYTLKIGVDHFKNKLGLNRVTKKPETNLPNQEVKVTTKNYDGLDFQIDVRSLSIDDSELTTRPKREASDEAGEDEGKF